MPHIPHPERVLDKFTFSNRAAEYYGGDVQAWSFVKFGPMDYGIVQIPHYLPPRIAARVVERDAKQARLALARIARCDDQAHA